MSQDIQAADANPSFEPEAFARNLARLMENGSKALAAYLKPRETGELRDQSVEEIGQVVKTFHSIADYWLSDPKRAGELQTRLGKAYLDLWGSAARRLAGEAPPATPHHATSASGIPNGTQTNSLIF
jgi:polyhydroxyalkanoate synthase